MPKIDLAAVPARKGVGYPKPFAMLSANRLRQRLGNAGGLMAFGVNLTRFPPANGPVSVIGTRTRMSSFFCSRASSC